jgi:hypothetical protein
MRRKHDDVSGCARHNGTRQCNGRRGNAGRIAAGLLNLLRQMPFGSCRLKGLNYDLVENLENGKDLSVIGWVRRGSAPILDQRGSHMLQKTSLTTPSTLPEKAVQDISGALLLLSDVFALYLKTKNFHWHMSGPHFRDYPARN